MSKPALKLATGPFKLIETPAHTQNLIKPYNQYIEAASVMALSHNVFIRGLNSIYLQAPHIQPSDIPDFIEYSKCWVEVLNNHHEMEETGVFPKIEEITGEEGIMEGNIEQHHAFVPGLQSLSTYLSTCTTTPSSFSGPHLLTLIDAFAPSLLTHLADEIPSILGLSRFGHALPLIKIFEKEGQKATRGQSKTGASSFFFRNLDCEFEGGRWRAWPAVPGPVWWIIQNTFVRWNGKWWRFASCDSNGKLRELPALVQDAVGVDTARL